MGSGSSLCSASPQADKNVKVAVVHEPQAKPASAEIKQLSPTSADQNQHAIGLHISAIRKFIEERPRVIDEHRTTSQINRNFFKPETIGTGGPFTHKWLGLKDPKTGVQLVSRATVFVSHAWRYNFYDVVVSVMEQYAIKHPDAYFWFDLFTNNQNEVMNKDFDWFCSTFRDSIREIGEVLLVLSPWNDPKPVRRAWCLFEIHNSIIDSEVELTMDIPLNEVEELKEGIIKDNQCVVQALSDIQAEKAEATSKTDLELISKAISQSAGGFSQVNQQVKEQLRRWYIEQLKLLIERTPDNTALTRNSASVMQDFAFVDEALLHYQNALQIDLKLYGDNHSYVGDSYHGMANAYQSKGDYERALDYYSKSLKIAEDRLGNTHPDVAASYNNMAMVYFKMGDNDKALEYYSKALQIFKETYDENHPDVALSYNNMANVYYRKFDYDKALHFYNKSIEIKLETLGDNHPDVAASYNNMANVYSTKGDNKKALEYCKKSLLIQQINLGENHPDVAVTYHNIAVIYDIQSDFDEALDYYSRSLNIRLDTLGDNHPDVAASYNNLAVVYGRKGDYDEALKYHNKALDIRLHTLADTHPDVANSYNNLGMTYYRKGDYEEALEYYHESLELRLETLGENHPDVANSYSNMGNAFHRKGDYEAALYSYNKSLTINLSVFGETHPSVQSARHNIELLNYAKEKSLHPSDPNHCDV